MKKVPFIQHDTVAWYLCTCNECRPYLPECSICDEVAKWKVVYYPHTKMMVQCDSCQVIVEQKGNK